MRSRLAKLGQARISSRISRPLSIRHASTVEYDPRPKEADPQLNGYPELPWVSLQHRPAKGWWDVQGRRNFGETLHENYDLLDMWGPDVSNIPKETALKQLTVALIGIASFGWVVYKLAPESPAVPRSYPFSGLVKELGGLEENKAREAAIEEEDN